MDLRGCLVDANRALVQAGGYTLDELRGRSFGDFLAADDAGDARARFEALAAGTIDTYRAERRYRSQDGQLHDVELIASLVRDEAGRPAGCLAVLHDLTAHKRALREAARRAAELEAVLENIPVAVYLSDETGVKAANRHGLEQLGFRTVEELLGASATVAEQLHLRDAATGQPITGDRRASARALTGEHVTTEIRIRHRRTGEDRLARVVAAPVALDNRIVGAVSVMQDITEQRSTEDALRLSEARYRELVEQAPLSIQILAPDGTTSQVNTAWERLWGVTIDDVAGYNLLHDPQIEARGLMPVIRRAFAGEAGHLPAILYDPDETLPDRSSHEDPKRWVRAVIYPIKDPDGSVREVVLIHEDITEQMHAEEQRRNVERERERLLLEAQRAHLELEAAGRVKDEFLAVLSHELRTPLNAVLGWARILRSRPIGEQAAHAVTVIERNATAQARLIDDLLDLSRIITGKTRLHLEDVELAALAGAALESVRPAADAKRIQITLDVAPDLPVISGDAHRLQQVLWNLLSNAVKFTEPGGSVTVTVNADPSNVSVDVTDTGIGISPAILPVVFDRFTQGDSSSTRAHSGLGLGLAIVRHLIELHGGTVKASSAGLGQGASFRFTIPR